MCPDQAPSASVDLLSADDDAPLRTANLLQAVRMPVKGPAAEWLPGLTGAQAEDWLDWLEPHGHPPAELSYQEGTGFAVWSPGLRVSREDNGPVRFGLRGGW
jgi:hypothetical protein